MSAAASRDARRTSLTREIYRRKSRDIYVHRDSGPGLGHVPPSTGRKTRRPSGPKAHNLKRYFATVPDADRKYLPVPKSFRKAQEKPAKKDRLNTVFKEIRKRFAIFDTILSYNFRDNLVADLVAGLAVTGLHFPQGLAYALLAGLPPGIGMVSTIFPVLIYMFFGSAAHTSIGTNAIVSIIIGDMLLEPAARAYMTGGAGDTTGDGLDVVMNTSDATNYTTVVTDAPLEAAIDPAYMERRIALVAGATFYTGIIFLVMAMFRMGFLVTYLSQSFMSGFTTGVAVHIFSSQIKTALGLKLPPIEGVGKLLKLYFYVCKYISGVNIGDLVVSLVCVVILLLVKIGINERLKPRVPIPIDFILLVLATIISHFANLPAKCGVHSLGTVELGIPSPQLPAFTPAAPLITYAIQIALVTFFLNISVIKIIARRNGYEINENIELNAYGMCNIIPAFFSNIPASVAPPRSALLSSMGAKTTMNAMSTFGIMLALIFYFGQFFAECPKAVLASMIMVAMKDLLKQVTILPKLWKVNKNDFTTWLIAAIVCVFADIPYGLSLGVLVSLLSVINQSQRGWVSVVGKSDSEDLYLDAEDYGAIHEIPGVKIVRMESSLYFATAEKFRQSIYKIIEKDSDKYAEAKEEEREDHNPILHELNEELEHTGSAHMLSKRVYSDTIKEENENENGQPDQEGENKEENTNHNGHDHVNHIEHDPISDGEDDEAIIKIKVLVIDCIPINFIDGTGLDMLKMVIFELGCVDISVYLARCSRYMLHLLEKSDMYDNFPRENVFIDLPDAVEAALKSSKDLAAVHKAHVVTMDDDSARMSRIRSIGSISTDYDKFIGRNSIYNQQYL